MPRIHIQSFINSRLGYALGRSLSLLPPSAGYALAHQVGNWIASRKRSPMVRAVRANQWVLHGCRLSASELDRQVASTFRHTARSLYEFWHFHRDPAAVRKMVKFDSSFVECFERARQAQSGLLVVVPHLSNFDLVGRAAVLHGYPLHILSYPDPPAAYRWQNSLRALPGLTITPLSISALNLASKTLRSGGTVVTGVDRPLPADEAKYLPRFLGRPARLPVFHIRLALKHNLPVVVVGGCLQPCGRYQVWASEPIPMIRNADLVQEIVQNAEAVLAVLAEFIQKASDQWAMFYPVWREALDEMP